MLFPMLDLKKFSNIDLMEMIHREKETLNKLLHLKNDEVPQEIFSVINVKMKNIAILEEEIERRKKNK